MERLLTNKISLWHLLLFVATLPFDRFYSQLVLASLLLHTLIHFREMQWRNLFTRKTLVLHSVFYLTMAGILYSPEPSLGYRDLEKQLAIFLFPILLAVNPLPPAVYRKKLLLVFGTTCTLVILYLYVDAARIMLHYQLPAERIFSASFLNHNFSAPVGIHASYLSLYAALSLAGFAAYYFESTGRRTKWLLSAGSIVLVAGLLQLGSRSVFLGLLVLLVVIIPVLYYRYLNRQVAVFSSVIVAGLLLAVIFGNDNLNERYVLDLRSDLAGVETGITDPRSKRWAVVWDLVRGEPLTGYGSGVERQLLSEEYFRNGLYHSFIHELNAHNQFLSMLVKHGLLGLLVFLATLFVGFWYSIRRRDGPFLAFMVLLAIISAGENFLDVNKGIFFYGFFFTFFLLQNREADGRREP